MTMIREYHRPANLEDALALLAESGARPIAGGTVVNARPNTEPVDVVDLQALGLDEVRADGDRLELGAMVRLQDLMESESVPGLLRELAGREAPSTLRRAATVGGTVAAADPESELLAGLLVFDAGVTVAHSMGSESIPLAELLADQSRLHLGIITSVSVAVGGDATAERTGRTPADRPIVMAVARRGEDGEVRLALTGVSSTPVLAEPSKVAELAPPADFRGSGEYRKELARVLSGRVLGRLGESA